VFISLWEDPVTHNPDHLDEHYGLSFTGDWRYRSLAVSGGAGGGIEYQLDILMCAKGMSPEACPGLYIALATDEDSDSSLHIEEVAYALTCSGSIVFIDCAQQYDQYSYPAVDLFEYYQPLAVNGGAVETGSIGTFTFQHMRQAILAQ